MPVLGQHATGCWLPGSFRLCHLGTQHTNALLLLCPRQAAAHVQFFIARTRMLANLIGFLPDMVTTPERTELVSSLQDELEALRSEYFAMLYGGRLKVAVSQGSELPRLFNGGRCLCQSMQQPVAAVIV